MLFLVGMLNSFTQHETKKQIPSRIGVKDSTPQVQMPPIDLVEFALETDAHGLCLVLTNADHEIIKFRGCLCHLMLYATSATAKGSKISQRDCKDFAIPEQILLFGISVHKLVSSLQVAENSARASQVASFANATQMASWLTSYPWPQWASQR
jgi:hypothetical protein